MPLLRQRRTGKYNGVFMKMCRVVLLLLRRNLALYIGVRSRRQLAWLRTFGRLSNTLYMFIATGPAMNILLSKA